MAFPVDQEWLEALSKGQEWLEGHPSRPEVVGRPSRRVGSGREAILAGQEWSGGPSKGPGVVGRPYRWA